MFKICNFGFFSIPVVHKIAQSVGTKSNVTLRMVCTHVGNSFARTLFQLILERTRIDGH